MIGPWNQLIEPKDIATIVALAVLEGLLSADNALVLALMVKHLSKEKQKKALLYGLGGAFVFRLVAILFATIVLKQWWLQAIGALYLVGVSIKHFAVHAQNKDVKTVERGFWATVLVVELTDIAFAVDSVLAGITFVGNNQSKIWVVFFGAIVGIVLLRFAATFFIKLLDRFPMLDHVAYLLVGWVGIKLSFISAHSWSAVSASATKIPEMPPALFWTVLLSIAVGGGYWATRKEDSNPPSLDDEVDLIEDAQEFEFTERNN